MRTIVIMLTAILFYNRIIFHLQTAVKKNSSAATQLVLDNFN